MQRSLNITLFLFICISQLFSYPLWVKSYGTGREDLSYYSGGHSMAQNAEGNFLISGFNVPSSGYNYYGRLLLVDQNGDTIWTKKFDFKPTAWNFSGFQLFPDQSIYTVVNWSNQKDSFEARLFHIGPDGSEISSTDLYNPYPENNQECWGMTQNNLGGLDIIASGTGGGYSTVRRMDADGNIVWLTTVGTGMAMQLNRDTVNEANHLVRQPDNGLMVCGWRNGEDLHADSGYDKAFVYKLNSDGDVQWFRTYGLKNSRFCSIWTGLACSNGENVFLGSQYDTISFKSKTFILRIDNTGDVVWERNVITNSEGGVVRELPDGTLEVMGKYWEGSSSSVTGFYILHLSADGDSLDCKIINSTDALMDAIPPKEGGLLLGFSSLTKGITLWRTDSDGNSAPVSTMKMRSSLAKERKGLLEVTESVVIFNNMIKCLPQEKIVMEVFNLNGRLVNRIMPANNNGGSSMRFPTGDITSGPKLIIIKSSNGKILVNKVCMFK